MNAIGNKEPENNDFVLLGQSHELHSPAEFAEGSLSWTNVAREIADALADEWFAEYSPAPITKVLPKNSVAGQELAQSTFANHLFQGEGVKLLPNLEISLSDLGDQVPLTESIQGKALLEALTRNGISWTYKTVFRALNQEPREEPEATIEGLAQWATYFEMPIVQSFRVFKNSKGKETVLWSSPMLIGTRHMEHITSIDFQGTHFEVSDEQLKKGVLPYGQWSSHMHIPAIFKRLFFLSETPFPSSIMNMPRSMAFSNVEPSSYPKPVMIRNTSPWIDGYYGHDGTQLMELGSIMPESIDVGWTFSTTNQDELQSILETVTNGLIRFATYLEDGYLNYRSVDYGFPYDLALFSGLCMDPDSIPEKSARGRSQWVPGVRVGLELAFTSVDAEKRNTLKTENGSQDELRQVLERVVFDGCGAVVPTLSNDYVFSYLLPEKDWAMIDFVLDNAMRYDIVVETGNSTSNLGLAKFKQGLLDEAQTLFHSALERLTIDEQSMGANEWIEEIRAEANYYLGQIALQQGHPDEAQKYSQACEASGGYTPLEEREEASPAAPSGGLGVGQKIGGGTLSGSGKIGSDTPPQAPSGAGLPPSTGKKIGGSPAPAESGAPGLVSTGNKVGGGGTASPVAKFCPSCGNKFGSDAEKFCGSCGTKRN